MHDGGLWLCTGCGDVIGLYEPTWIEHDDGLTRVAWLAKLDREERDRAERLYHIGCVARQANWPGTLPR